jgi:phage tail sheath protein FI
MRLNVVNSISPILQAIQDAGAIQKYELVMDESNNTQDIVDDGFAIIDIGVWINKGMEKIINRITVNRNEGTSTGGFTAV